MPDFAIATRAVPFAALSATIASIERSCPDASVFVGVDTGEDDTATYLRERHPGVEVVAGTTPGLGAQRSALAAQARSRYLFFVPVGVELTGGVQLSRATDLMQAAHVPLLFATTRRAEPASTVTPIEAMYVATGDQEGQVSYDVLEPDAGTDSLVAADVGGDAFIIDRHQIGAGCELDWDPAFGHAFENRDLFMAILRSPSAQAQWLPTLTVHQTADRTPNTAVEETLALARFLRKWRIHTERFGADDIRRHVIAGAYQGPGTRLDVRARARRIVRSKWRDPSALAQALARSLTVGRFNEYVVSKNPDLLVHNMVIARDGSWLYVSAAHCAEEPITAWLARMETGLPTRSAAGGGPGLLRPRDIGIAETVRLIERRDTFKFTFVRHPFDRIAAAHATNFSGVPTHPPAEALRNLHHHRREAPADPETDLDLVGFLTEVDQQPAHERDRQWRPLNDALVADRFPYDFIGRVETFSADIERVAHALARAGGRPVPPPPTALATITGTSGLDDEAAELARRIYAQDFTTFGYEPEPDGTSG